MSENAISQPSGVLHDLHLSWYLGNSNGRGERLLPSCTTYIFKHISLSTACKDKRTKTCLKKTESISHENMRLRSNIVMVASTFMQSQCANE